MQKLKRISSGQNNKSCSTNHHGSNKNGFTFFWIFCDFLCNLQFSANCSNYWSYLLAIRTLERVECLKFSPYGGRPARAEQFRRGRRGSWPGKGRRMVRGLGGSVWVLDRAGGGSGERRAGGLRQRPPRARSRRGKGAVAGWRRTGSFPRGQGWWLGVAGRLDGGRRRGTQGHRTRGGVPTRRRGVASAGGSA
jgi:hypothetical protein